MDFWCRFYTDEGEDKWTLAYSKDFDALTQGKDFSEAYKMAQDLLVLHLQYKWAKDLDVKPCVRPKGEGWHAVRIPETALLALSLKRERMRQGRTMQELADSLGVALGTYQKWEDPRRANPTIGTLAKLANVLGKNLQVTLQ